MRAHDLIVIGRGNVGGTLIKQLEARRAALAAMGLDLRIAATIDMPEGGWEAVTATADKLGLERPIIIDATAADSAAGHLEWLARGWSVVTANKKPISGPLATYDRLAAARDAADAPRYFHETAVGAGLPVIHTLKELLETGDEVIEIRAALSGTMGYIFSECGKGRPFLEAVADAKAKGFTEPDPRDDLAGTDIARKALVLGRMIGLRLELADIATENLAGGMLSPEPIDERFRRAAASGRKLRYLASVTPGGVKVGIAELPASDPFAGLEGPENLIVFRTKRYDAAALSVRGPGAGAAVTAAGLFGDILRAARGA